MEKIIFSTVVLQVGNNTGIEVPPEILEKLKAGKKPLVVVSVNGHSYRSAVATMMGKFLISLSAENRKKAGVNGGDVAEVILQLDTSPRTVEIPEELQQAFNGNNAAKAAFDKLAPGKQKAIVISINEARSTETKSRRIQKALESIL